MLSKLLKGIALLFGLLVVIAAGAVIYIKTALPDVGPAPELTVGITPERVARGEYLAHHVAVCMDCHSTRDWSLYSGPLQPGTLGKGGEVFDHRFGFPGTFVSRNITPSGVGAWSDGELYRAITTGVTRDGRALFNIMPYENYGRMDPEDIKSIIAYVRSLPSIESTVPDPEPDFPVNILLNTIPRPAEPETLPPATDTLAYGRYLTNAAACVVCHTKHEKGKAVGEPFAGGFEFSLGDGAVIRSTNITPHETGIQALRRVDFIQRFKAYEDAAASVPVDMANGDIQTVMPWIMYAGMTEQDLGAIYDFLRTVAPVENRVERWTPPTKE